MQKKHFSIINSLSTKYSFNYSSLSHLAGITVMSSGLLPLSEKLMLLSLF